MESISHKKVTGAVRIINIVLSAVFILVIAFVTTVHNNKQHEAYAQAGTPFGGQSAYVFYCTCSVALAITVEDLAKPVGVSLPLLYEPGATELYPYGQVYSEGVWLLGLWSGGGVCEYYVGKGCATYPVEGTMTMVGTSM